MESKRISDHSVNQHNRQDQKIGKQQCKPRLLTVGVVLTWVLLLGNVIPEVESGESRGEDQPDPKVDLWLPFRRTAEPGHDAAALPHDLSDSSHSVAGLHLQQVSPKGEGHSVGKVCTKSFHSNTEVIPCKAETLGPRVLPAETSIIETNSLPTIYNHLPEIGNGHVATVVGSDTIFMNGLYNGANATSHRARIPSRAVNASVISPLRGRKPPTYRLDLGRGVFSEEHAGDGFTLEVRRYAHRNLTRLLVTDVIFTRTTSTQPIVISYSVNSGSASEDISFVQEGLVWNGMTKEPEFPQLHGTTPVSVVHSSVLPNQTFDPETTGASTTFITSVGVSQDDALQGFYEGENHFLAGSLLSSHVEAWGALWRRGHLQLTGNVSMATTANAAQYYLLTALPLQVDAESPFVGMAPGGLAHGGKDKDYSGHVSWDQDTWMFPPIALLHADIGRILLGARIRTLKSAQMNANMSGWSGALYPTESGFTGLEVDPSQSKAVYEIHGTGDVAWAMRQYLQLTNDTDFLSEGGGYEALASIADYWVSRSMYNSTRGVHEIRGVMGPDELNWPVNNSVYTNVVAVDSLLFAETAALLVGRTPNIQWAKVAHSMVINYDSHLDYHPEYDNYKIDTQVKQADVVLLQYPHGWQMNDTTRINDLRYYASVTPGGPAMTWGIFAINWLRLGNLTEADHAFDRGTQNVQQPFRVWAENADGSGAYNFHTGMGGYLQSLIFGYMGVDITDRYLGMEPHLPPSLTAMTLTGLDYRGSSLDVTFNATTMKVTLTKAAPLPLNLLFKTGASGVYLRVGRTVSVPTQTVCLSCYRDCS